MHLANTFDVVRKVRVDIPLQLQFQDIRRFIAFDSIDRALFSSELTKQSILRLSSFHLCISSRLHGCKIEDAIRTCEILEMNVIIRVIVQNDTLNPFKFKTVSIRFFLSPFGAALPGWASLCINFCPCKVMECNPHPFLVSAQTDQAVLSKIHNGPEKA